MTKSIYVIEALGKDENARDKSTVIDLVREDSAAKALAHYYVARRATVEDMAKLLKDFPVKDPEANDIQF